MRRTDRALALAIDLGWGAAAMLVATMVAFTWLFVRTEWGRYPVGDGDSIAAAALIGGAIPAWLAWLALGLAWDGATPGQRARRLAVRVEAPARPFPRSLRLAAHPVGAAGWLWLAILTWLLTFPWWFPALLALISGTILLMGGATAIRVIRNPAARGVHDLIAGTTLARSEELQA